MTKAIEHIVSGYTTLKNRRALEEIRDHRKRMLTENRISAASSGFNLDRISNNLQEELSIVEAALSRLSMTAGPSEIDPGLDPIHWSKKNKNEQAGRTAGHESTLGTFRK